MIKCTNTRIHHSCERLKTHKPKKKNKTKLELSNRNGAWCIECHRLRHRNGKCDKRCFRRCWAPIKFYSTQKIQMNAQKNVRMLLRSPKRLNELDAVLAQHIFAITWLLLIAWQKCQYEFSNVICDTYTYSYAAAAVVSGFACLTPVGGVRERNHRAN